MSSSTTAASEDVKSDVTTTTPTNNVQVILQACSSGDMEQVKKLIEDHKVNVDSNDSNCISPASLQDDTTGTSPLMAAATSGHIEICRHLLEAGAPWNAIDRKGKCAGNYATEKEHWDIVNLLVDAGTKAELILGATIRLNMQLSSGTSGDTTTNNDKEKEQEETTPVEQEPCTKPDYLNQNVRYNASETALLDEDNDAVMMEWERPLMDAHASIITSNSQKGKRVLNVGFGMGIIDTALQKLEPSLHVIIEAHPTVHQKMIKDGWDKKKNVRICFGRWQDVMPELIKEGITFDGMFYDTYGEHFTDLEDFQDIVAETLVKPTGIYSFFNGLAPDNLFFHGVACQCVKLQLAKLGFDSEFAPCEIKVKDSEWDGVRRKYWHGRETYYLPIITWKEEFLNPKKKLKTENENENENECGDESNE